MNGTEAALLALKKTDEIISRYKMIEGQLFRIEEKITRLGDQIINQSGTISKVEKQKEVKVPEFDYNKFKEILQEALSDFNFEKSTSSTTKTFSSTPKKAYIPKLRMPDDESSTTIKMDDE